jgi:hypothetical protein
MKVSRQWRRGSWPTRKTGKEGGAGVPARQLVRTGWKACATGKNFLEQGTGNWTKDPNFSMVDELTIIK